MSNSIPTDQEIEARIHALLSANPDTFDEILAYLDQVEEHYYDDVREFTFREAIIVGAYHYVRANACKFDLNDRDGYSTYLHETDDPDMQEILMDNGAFKSWEDYEDYRFAVETVNGEILYFDDDLQQEAFDKYLKKTGLTVEEGDHVIILGKISKYNTEYFKELYIETMSLVKIQ